MISHGLLSSGSAAAWWHDKLFIPKQMLPFNWSCNEIQGRQFGADFKTES